MTRSCSNRLPARSWREAYSTTSKRLHLDRGYDSGPVRELCARPGIADLVAARKRKAGDTTPNTKLTLGMRWPVERTNSWLSNFGQLRRNTDRRSAHRLAQLALAVTLLLTAKLVDWRDRWAYAPPLSA